MEEQFRTKQEKRGENKQKDFKVIYYLPYENLAMNVTMIEKYTVIVMTWSLHRV